MTKEWRRGNFENSKDTPMELFKIIFKTNAKINENVYIKRMMYGGTIINVAESFPPAEYKRVAENVTGGKKITSALNMFENNINAGIDVVEDIDVAMDIINANNRCLDFIFIRRAVIYSLMGSDEHAVKNAVDEFLKNMKEHWFIKKYSDNFKYVEQHRFYNGNSIDLDTRFIANYNMFIPFVYISKHNNYMFKIPEFNVLYDILCEKSGKKAGLFKMMKINQYSELPDPAITNMGRKSMIPAPRIPHNHLINNMVISQTMRRIKFYSHMTKERFNHLKIFREILI